MYREDIEWCESEGIPAESLHPFTKAMNAARFNLKRRRNGFDEHKKPQFIKVFQGCSAYAYATYEEYKKQLELDAEVEEKEKEKRSRLKNELKDILKSD